VSSVPMTLNSDSTLSGAMLWVAGIVLALANFVAVLNMTIANVTVRTSPGRLAQAPARGPGHYLLRGGGGYHGAFDRLAVRAIWRGQVVLYLRGALRSLLAPVRYVDNSAHAARHAGVAGHGWRPLIGALSDPAAAHLPQGAVHAGHGPLGDDDAARPVVGPVLGGWLCDNYSWSWVFLINVPMALIFALIAWTLLKRYQDPAVIKPVDKIGMLLLVIWVAALQIMLDEGKDLDWFSSLEIRVLAIVAVIGFLSFLIWELTEQYPIVDLRVFRHRGFASCMLVLALAFGAFFGINVLTPQWLQYNMGYTTTWAGLVVAWEVSCQSPSLPSRRSLLTGSIRACSYSSAACGSASMCCGARSPLPT